MNRFEMSEHNFSGTLTIDSEVAAGGFFSHFVGDSSLVDALILGIANG